MTGQDNTRLGIFLMILVTIVFSVQDGISQHLASRYNVIMVVMIRYWFFAAFVIALAQRQPGGVRQVAVTSQLPLQIFRGVLLAVEICVTVVAFTLFGLVETHAVFVCYPLLVAAMSGPVLGEYVGWRRWTAIGVGFVGVLIILEPGSSVFSIYALVPFFAAFLFALYALLTRYAARRDSTATNFFLDRHRRCCAYDPSGHLVLAIHEPCRLGLDGSALYDGGAGPLAAYSLLRGCRGECGATVRVFTAGFCINCRDCGVFRNVAQQCCGWGLDDHGCRCFCTIERAAEDHRQLVLC